MDPNRTENARMTPTKDLGAESATTMASYVKRRIITGLLATLPLFVTLWIIQFTYTLLITSILNPILQSIMRLFGLIPAEDMPAWWDMIVAPGLVLMLLGLLLFIMGGFARSRVYWAIDWIIRRVPVVKTIYDAVYSVIHSIDQSAGSDRKFEKVVLFEFPNSRVKSLGFVTNTLNDPTGDRPIYAVMLLTGVMPPTGFTLFVPADEVIELAWSPTQAIQAIVSGGLSVPEDLPFHLRDRLDPQKPSQADGLP